jgi:AhpD family alkylhydroperoxidase
MVDLHQGRLRLGVDDASHPERAMQKRTGSACLRRTFACADFCQPRGLSGRTGKPKCAAPFAISEITMSAVTHYPELIQGVSKRLASLRTSTPEVMKSFGELGRAATADGALDRKTKELIALALSVASRCEPCIGFHMQTLVKLAVTRQEIDETLGVTTYMGGGPSLMYAASAIAAFEAFSEPQST